MSEIIMKSYSMHPAVPATVVSALNLDMAKPFAEQVTAFFEKAGDLSGYSEFALPGQAVAAILTLPVLEMSVGFPVTPVLDIGKKQVVGVLDLGRYRHNVVRPRRSELLRGEAYAGYTVIDGAGRGLTPAQLVELKKLLGNEDVRVLAAPLGQLDFTNPTAGVVDTLLKTDVNWETLTSGQVLYLPAGMGLGAVIQATAIYGLSEVWPKTIRLNRNPDGTFSIAEVVDPQSLRAFGVGIAAAWHALTAPIPVPRELVEKLTQYCASGNDEGRQLAAELREVLRG
jgi:hypothetical protein